MDDKIPLTLRKNSNHLMEIPIQTKMKTSSEISMLIKSALEDKKAQNISIIDLTDKSYIADYLIIATGLSSRQNSAMARSIIELLKGIGIFSKVEGESLGEWVLIDTGSVIVHLFKPETREYYNIEQMWNTNFRKD